MLMIQADNSINVFVTRADCAMNYGVILYFMTLVFCTPLHGIAQHCTTFYSTARYGTAPYYNVLHRMERYLIILQCTTLHCMASYCSTKYSTALNNTAMKHSDVKRYLMDVHSRVKGMTPGDRKHNVTNNC